MSDATEVRIKAISQYVPAQSSPKEGKFFFAYRITIENHGPAPVRLLARHWVITDARHHVEEVQGEGVVGEQPLIAPGKSFSYTSFCPLRTEFGTMHGSYLMQHEGGATFEAEIPPFILSNDETVN
jgi:ApaG protein